MLLSVESCEDYRPNVLIVIVRGAGLLPAQPRHRVWPSSKELWPDSWRPHPQSAHLQSVQLHKMQSGRNSLPDCLLCLHQAFQHCYFLTGTDHWIPETLPMYLTMVLPAPVSSISRIKKKRFYSCVCITFGSHAHLWQHDMAKMDLAHDPSTLQL